MKIHFLVLTMFVSLGILQSCSGGSSSNLPNLPAYKVIFDKFYSKYGAPEGEYIEFAKKPAGYYVVEKDANLKILKEHLFWSTATRQFNKLPAVFSQTYKPGGAPMGEYYSRMYSFDHALYYNYPDAADESIKALEGMNDKNDTLYEMLGRAYSIKCDQVSGGRQGQGNNMKGAAMSREEADEFIKAGKKMIDAYKQLMKLNPHYETIVGKIRTQYAHQHVYMWMELAVSGYADLSKQFLVDGIYDDLVLNFARNMLTSCPENSILFTHGDTDTYPLMYLQQTQNYRKDVSVLNCSLLNVPAYLGWYVKTGNIETSLSMDDYKNKLTDYIIVNRTNQDKGAVPLQQFIAGIKIPDESALKINTGSTEILQLPSNIVELTVTGKHIDPFEQDRKQAEKHVFTINESYLYKSDIFVLDVMLTSAWKRPIAFASSGETNITSSTKSFMDNYGLVDVIAPFEKSFSNEQSTINPERLHDLVMKKYAYKVKYNKGYEAKGLVTNYLILFSNLSTALSKQDMERTTLCLTRAENEIPFLTYPEEMEGLVLNQAMLWASVKNTEKANTILGIGLDEIERHLKKEMENYERERLVHMIDYVVLLAGQNNLEAVKKRAEALQVKYQK